MSTFSRSRGSNRGLGKSCQISNLHGERRESAVNSRTAHREDDVGVTLPPGPRQFHTATTTIHTRSRLLTRVFCFFLKPFTTNEKACDYLLSSLKELSGEDAEHVCVNVDSTNPAFHLTLHVRLRLSRSVSSTCMASTLAAGGHEQKVAVPTKGAFSKPDFEKNKNKNK